MRSMTLRSSFFSSCRELRRRELVVEDHDVDVSFGARGGEARDFAGCR